MRYSFLLCITHTKKLSDFKHRKNEEIASIIPKDLASMPFLLPLLLSFQGSAHLCGVGSFSNLNLENNSTGSFNVAVCG